MSEEAEDWLEMPPLAAEEVATIVHEAVMDDVTLRDKNAVAPAGLPPLEARLVQALRRLRPIERTYLRAYVKSGCNRSAATKAFNRRGIALPDSTSVARWFQKPAFKTALDAMKKVYLDTAGLDPQSVMLKAGKVYEKAMDPQPVLHQGEDTGFREVDLGNAMRAIEFMGRVNKMTTGDENGARVTLHIVNIADREQRDVVSEQ